MIAGKRAIGRRRGPSRGHRSRVSLVAVVALSCLALFTLLATFTSLTRPSMLDGQGEGKRAKAASSFAEFLRERVAQASSSRGFTVAVVGNGPITNEQRDAVGRHADFIVRFNDCSYFRPGDKTGLRVVRHPFSFHHELVSAPVWHVAPHRDLCPSHRPGLPLSLCQSGAAVFTAVYQYEYGLINELDDGARIFPSCDSRDSNLQARRFGGPSSGGVVISELEQTPEVHKILVFGMNWNGNPHLHIDFANSSLVSGCCTKCIIHPTVNTAYGNKSKTYFMQNPDDFYRRMQGA